MAPIDDPSVRVGLPRARLALTFAAGACLSFVAMEPAAAQYVGRGPWCAYVLSATAECYFQTFEQCWATASGVTNRCVVNPYYVPPAPRRGPPPPRRSRR